MSYSSYTKVYTNLNARTKGSDVFLCYERKIRESTSPITGLNVLAGPKYFRTPIGYTRVNADMNAGLSEVGCVYLFYTRTTTLPKISSIAVMDTNMDPYTVFISHRLGYALIQIVIKVLKGIKFISIIHMATMCDDKHSQNFFDFSVGFS